MWYTRLRNFSSTINFNDCYVDPSLFIYRKDNHRVFLFVYVDDNVFMALDDALVEKLIKEMGVSFHYEN